MLILFSFLRTRIFKNFPRRHVCLIELEEGVFKPRETRWIFQGGFSPLASYQEGWSEGTVASIKAVWCWYLGWLPGKAPFGCRSGCSLIRKSPLPLINSAWKLLLGKIFAGVLFWRCFFFFFFSWPLIFHLPPLFLWLWEICFFMVLLGGLGHRVCAHPRFSPCRLFFNFRLRPHEKFVGKVISRAIC